MRRTSSARAAHASCVPKGGRHVVATSPKLATSSGRRIASTCAVMPPSDNPTTCVGPNPNASISPAKSSASISTEYGACAAKD